MAVPVIDTLTSIQEHRQFETWRYQPSADQVETLVGSGAVDDATDVFTWSSAPPANGSRVRLKTTGVAPGGFSVTAVYFTRDVAGSTCKLAATAGGAAIDATDVGTGTLFLYKAFTWSATGLPEGMSINEFTGLVSGAVIIGGVYVMRIAAKNWQGDEGTLDVVVGIEPTASAGARFPTLILNTLTGTVRGIGSDGQIAEAADGRAVLYLKSKDLQPVIVRFRAGPGFYTPDLTSLKLTVKADETEKITLSAGGIATDEELGAVTADAGSDEFTQPASPVSDGQRVYLFTTGTLPAGSTDAVYFVINADVDSFQVSTTKDGDPVDLGDAGTGTLVVIRKPGNCEVFGADDWGYAVILVSVDSSSIKTSLGDNERPGGTFFYGVGELEFKEANPFGVGASPIIVTSRYFLVRIEREMTPN